MRIVPALALGGRVGSGGSRVPRPPCRKAFQFVFRAAPVGDQVSRTLNFPNGGFVVDLTNQQLADAEAQRAAEFVARLDAQVAEVQRSLIATFAPIVARYEEHLKGLVAAEVAQQIKAYDAEKKQASVEAWKNFRLGRDLDEPTSIAAPACQVADHDCPSEAGLVIADGDQR